MRVQRMTFLNDPACQVKVLGHPISGYEKVSPYAIAAQDIQKYRSRLGIRTVVYGQHRGVRRRWREPEKSGDSRGL